MGAYINPSDTTKEQWLSENAERLDYIPAFNEREGMLPVCLILNKSMGFSAAAIGFSESEIERFMKVGDTRPKIWFFANVVDLFTVSLELKGLIEESNGLSP